MGFLRKKDKQSIFSNEAQEQTLHKHLRFTATEQYKLLRTNLDFTLPQNVKCPIIGITSSMRSEGKSTTSINLSYALAERGSKVLLIDGDLRLPSIAKKMRVKNTPGLTDLIMGKEIELSIVESGVLDNWYILPSGHIPPNPSELLGSDRMSATLSALQEQFEYIIIDLPPVNIVSDALSISRLITGMILIVREDRTEKKELARCFRQLRLSNVNLLGCVMNESKTEGGPYRKRRRRNYYKLYSYESKRTKK